MHALCPGKLGIIFLYFSWPHHIAVNPAGCHWQLSPALSLALRFAAFRALVELRRSSP